MVRRLVIVESPAKGRTIGKFLGEDFVVRASMGHIRDLPENAAQIPAAVKGQPWARLGVDIENDFAPLYVVPADKKKHVKELKEELKNVDELLLATDEDREGESISWHLVQELRPKVPVKRMVFHEITKEAIQEALENTRSIDEHLVQAQEARRIVDRLYGYEVSPVLWKKVRPKLSAGRVQSVAIRMLVDRERERMAFRDSVYWDLLGRFAADGQRFDAGLVSVGGRRVASGRDFDPATGKLRPDADVTHLDRAAAEALAARLRGAPCRVAKVETKPFTQKPSPPFTTSTLQQEGGRKLGWSAKRTMRIAQSLYENGYITYMRTDSTNLSKQAIDAARRAVRTMYGEEFLHPKVRVFSKKVKNAQEAHEAIRPAGESFRTPSELGHQLDLDQRKLYALIWKRTMACQMAEARCQRTTVHVEAEDAVFSASGKTILFPGYLRAYVEGSDDPEADLADKERLLPALAEGQPLSAEAIEAKEHRTQPPPRLTEAALVKALEQNGIGRPSTYASIIDTIERRDYTFKKGNTLVPTWIAFAVVQLLRDHFPDLVDLAYTARLEDDLDGISRGEGEQIAYLRRFYFGAADEDDHPGLHRQLVEKTEEIDPRLVCTIPIGKDDRGEAVNVRVGRYGPYLERGEDRGQLPDGLCPDELTLQKAVEVLAQPQGPRELGAHPETGMAITVRNGRFGPYVQMEDPDGGKPKNSSLLKGMDPGTVTLGQALDLLSLPRVVGQDESGEDILAALGRFGPYIKRGSDTRSLAESDDVLTVTRERALELLAQEKAGRRGSRRTPEPMKVFDAVSELDGAAIKLMEGRFGPYVTDGETNASLPRGKDPGTLTPAEAANLIIERRLRGPSKKAKRSAAKKPARKKKATKKKTSRTKKAAKKTAARKTSAKKKGAAKKKASKSPAAARKA